MQARCDACGITFPVVVHEAPLPDGGLDLQLICPSCGRVYPVAHYTARGLRLQRQIEELRADPSRPPDARSQAEMAKLTTRLKREVTR